MKQLITTIFTFSIFIISYAQISFGAKAGYTNSTMKFKDASEFEFDARSSFYIGGFIEDKISDKFSIQAEVQYTELGGKKSLEITELIGSEVVNVGTAKIEYVNKQIQVPLLAKYYLAPKFSILGGLNVGFTVSKKFKTDFNTEFFRDENAEFFKTVSFYPVLGAEFQFYKNIFAEARYNFGLFNAAKPDTINTSFDTFQIGLGYKF